MAKSDGFFGGRARLLIVALSIAITALVGCQGAAQLALPAPDTHESLRAAILETVERLAETLAVIQDEQSADLHRSELQQQAKALSDYMRRKIKLPADGQQLSQQAVMDYAERFARSFERMLAEKDRINSSPALRAPLESAMTEINQAIWDLAFAKVEQDSKDEAAAAAANGPLLPPPPTPPGPAGRRPGAPPSDFMEKSGFRPPISPDAAATRERIERIREEARERRKELGLPPLPGAAP
jgi:hypothetical protein